jgi:hypothetical protein
LPRMADLFLAHLELGQLIHLSLSCSWFVLNGSWPASPY